MKRYRMKGKRKRAQLLHWQVQGRFAKVQGRAVFLHVEEPSCHISKRETVFQKIGQFLFGAHLFRWIRHWWSGNQRFSLKDPVLSFCWDPLKATRVGEAANPGPAGSRATTRKREERESADDRQLAGALLAVLQTYQKDDPTKDVGEPPAKKGKGGILKPRPSQGPSLAQSLLQMVQSAIDNNWSDQELTSRVTQKLERIVHPSQVAKELLAPRQVRFQDDRPNPEPRAPPPVKGKARGKTKQSPGSLKEPKQMHLDDAKEFPPLAQGAKPSKISSVTQETKQPAKFSRASHGFKPDRLGKARFAARVLQREWHGDTNITSIPQILAALRDDKAVPGNLIVSSDPLVVDEAKQIWQAYELSDDLTVAIVASGQEIGPTMSVWWTLDKNRPMPCRYKFRIHQVGEFDGPTPQPAQVVQMPGVKAPKQVTLRLLTPEHYRSFVAGVHKTDTPVSVIGEWAQLVAEPVASFTGGTWERLATPRGQLLIAHIRTSESLANKVCSLSGRRGLFATVVQKQGRAPVSWQFRSKEATDETYFRAAEKEAQQHKVPLALRQGGPHDVGLIGIDPRPESRTRQRSWELYGAPSHWYQHEVESFLTSEGWKSVVLKTRVRRRGQGVWLFQAICPPFQTGDLDGGSWSYTNADGSCHMSITLEGPRKRKPFQTERLNGPRKQWTDKGHSFTRPQAATQIDSSDSEKEEPKENPNGNSPRTTQQSGSNKRHKNVLPAGAVSADDWIAQNHPQWQIWDDGGSGDCGFRSTVRSLAVMQGKEYESTKVISEASRLRTLCVGHLLKNKGDYEDFFAPDPQATADQRDGNPEPDSFSDYIMLASKKNFWIDGLMLMGLSHRLGRAFVVFVWSNRDKGWDRHVLAPSFDDKKKAKSPSGTPVCLLLKSGHYRALVPKTSDVKFPQEWLLETPMVDRAVLRGAGASKPSCPSLSIPPSTPKANGVQRKSLVPSTPCRQAGSSLSLPSQTPVQSREATRKATGERLPSMSLVSKKRSHISEPSLSDFSSKRPKGNGRPPSAEIAVPPRNEPYVQLPEPISVWWTCSCGLQVLQHKDLTCHGPRRKKHLNQVHGFSFGSMPHDPPGAPREGPETHREERFKRCRAWLTLAKKHGWAGLHQLTPVSIGWRRWQCQACKESFTHWNRGVQSLCSTSTAAGRSKLPNIDKRLQLANQWWAQAVDQIAKDKVKNQDLLNHFSFLNNQKRLSLACSLSSPPKLFGGIPLVPSEVVGGQPQVWWSCSMCNFKIFDSVPPSGRSYKRNQHLRNVHGYSKVPPIPKQGFAIRAVQASQSVVKQRWEHRVAEFQKRAWAGAHDIDSKAVCVTTYTCKSGKVLQYPRYQCKRCCRTVTAGDMPISICSSHPGRSKAPDLNRRKQIWQKCLQVAAQLSKVADGMSATRRGKRACRVGEASHPGPSDHNLLLWTVNVRSWYANGPHHLDEAAKHGVSVIFFQETNLSENACPSVSQACASKGWQILLCPTASRTTNRGGVAIAVRQPFALSFRSQSRSPEGQTLTAVLHGGQHTISLAVHYRHPSAKNLDGVTTIINHFEACRDKFWIVAMDSNTNLDRGPIPDGFAALGGHRVATARHVKGSYPIDALFASYNLRCSPDSCAELPCLAGDHTRAQAGITLQFPRCGLANHRFAKTRTLCSREPAPVSWGSVASSNADWAASLSQAETAWNLWAHDVEAWMTEAHILDQREPEKFLAQEPKIRAGAHRLGLFQPLKERQCRRLLRRLTEARMLQHKGSPIPPNLFAGILRSPVLPKGLRFLVQSHAWGRLLVAVQDQLEQVQKQTQSDKLQQWKENIHTLHGACQWAKKVEAAPSAVSVGDQVVVSPAQVAAALKTSWEKIFGTHEVLVDEQQFLETFSSTLPEQHDELPLPGIAVEEIKKAARKMAGKAAGPDGFQAEFLLLLPDIALSRLAELYSCFEKSGEWPRAMIHWRLAFLPKAKKNSIPTPEEMRPIAIGHVLYRLWARVRLLHVQSHVKQFLAPFQSGYQGPSCQDLFLSWDQEFEPDQYGYCGALDYTKAFDSLDYSLPVAIFKRCGLPAPIINLLSHQWSCQIKWASFNGTIHGEPIRHAKGLPQGDAWSPLALTLVLSVVSRHQALEVPEAIPLLFLDDRTIVSQSKQSLFDAISCWERFETVSRMRTNAAKTQFVARTSEALLDFQTGGTNAATVGAILGVSLGMTPRPDTQKEQDRAAIANRCASRIGTLPVSLSFRAAIAASILTSKMSWGALFNGRSPNTKQFQRMFKTAVHGNLKNARASVPLTKFFLWGHRGDILFVACQNFLKAVTSWRASRPGIRLKLDTPVFQAFRKALGVFQCSINAEGRVSWSQGFWDTSAPLGFCDRFAHNLRVQWRKIMLSTWLASKRNDASIAREANLQVSTELVEKLHSTASRCAGHEIAIMCGGLLPNVHLHEGTCNLCSSGEYPTTAHILWECPRFQDLRTLPPPRDVLVARLGWGISGVNHPCVSQLGKIRDRACAANRSRSLRDYDSENAVLNLAGAADEADPTAF